MAHRIVDPTRLLLTGGLIDWTAVFRQQAANKLKARSPADIARERELKGTRMVQLRWLTAEGVGLPTEPFKVWRRPSLPFEGEKPFDPPTTTFFGLTLRVFDAPRLTVRLHMSTANPGGGSVIAFSGAPLGSGIVGSHVLNAAGSATVRLAAPQISCLLCSPGVTISALAGVADGIQEDGHWQLVEVVGLPVDKRFSGVFDLAAPQGPAGALGDPMSAALDRFRRGAPFYGWQPQVTPALAAPPWQLADPVAMLKLIRAEMLEPIRDMVTTLLPPQHRTFEQVRQLASASGGQAATARFKPLSTLLFGAGTDPLASLMTGYGTALEDIDLPPISFSDRQFFGDASRSDWDYMVTARWSRGLDHASAPLELAALLMAPKFALPPPAPTQVVAQLDGLRTPAGIDADYHGVVRVNWDRPSGLLPLRVGSYAFVRAAQTPAGPLVPLMDKRPNDIALQPIGASGAPDSSPEPTRWAALDERYAVATAPDPNAVLYGLAHQDLLGLWSAWSTAGLTLAEPPVRPLSILSARLEVSAVASGPCPATLEIEVSWDWSSRSPERLELVGRLYAQTRLGDAPSDTSVPTGLAMLSGGGAGPLLRLQFGGSASGTPALVGAVPSGATVALAYVAFDGRTLVAAPPASAGPRRYRLTVSGLRLDFDAAPRIGLALWGRGVEHRAPQRIGAWSAQPTVASTADPRPPVIAVEHEDVLLASMADASGLHHARLTWPAAPNAAGYFIYTCTEEKLRADRGLPSPGKSLTLSERLSALRNAFAADPDRRSFARVNSVPITGLSTQVSLPRGSKEIHLYVVIGSSAGNVESAWPGPGDPLLRRRPIAYAAPQVVVPMPPDLEVSRGRDDSTDPPTFHAAVTVRCKPGPRVTRIDLHRVRVAAATLELDTMGPPAVTLSGSTGGWVATPQVSTEPGMDQPLARITGRDAVEGSWKKVWYRAVAWSADDPARGLFGGRSGPSALREVVVPPAGPPDLSALSGGWPGGADLLALQIDATTQAPVAETPLGPHRLRVELLAEAPDGSSRVLFRHPAAPGPDGSADRLDHLPELVPAPGTTGVWQAPSGAPGTTRLRLQCQRPDADSALRVRFLLIDPLGRSRERELLIAAGLPLPAPDILAFSIRHRPALGILAQFQTSALFESTSAGPYVLTIRWVPSLSPRSPLLPSPLPFPSPRPMPGRPIRTGPIAQLTVTLPDLRRLGPGEDLMLDPAAIPARRLPDAGDAEGAIGFALRGRHGGRLSLTLRGPDGRVATLSRTLR